MINAFFGIGILTAIVYSLLVDFTFAKIYLLLLLIYYLITQVFLLEHDPIFLRRKIAISSWGAPSDPQIYIPVDYDMTKTLKYLERLNSYITDKDKKITITHIVTKAVAIALYENQKYFGRIGFGTFKAEKEINVTVLVNQNNTDLVPVLSRTPFAKSLSVLAEEFNLKAKRAREDKDEDHSKMKQAIKFLPTFVMGPVLSMLAYLSLNLGIGIPGLIKPKQQGLAYITNIGALGLSVAFGPLTPPMFAPILVVVGKIEKKPKVVEDRIEARETLSIVYTVDHRMVDGGMMVNANKMMKELIEEPERMEIFQAESKFKKA